MAWWIESMMSAPGLVSKQRNEVQGVEGRGLGEGKVEGRGRGEGKVEGRGLGEGKDWKVGPDCWGDGLAGMEEGVMRGREGEKLVMGRG